MEKLKQFTSKLEMEKRSLQDELGKTEARATKLELQRMSLEGDLQRLQMILQEKEAHIQVKLYKYYQSYFQRFLKFNNCVLS